MAPSRAVALLLSILSILFLTISAFAAAPDRIPGPIVASQTMTLGGGTPISAHRGTDRGPVDPSLKLPYITLVTIPSPAQRRATNKLYIDQQNPHSPSYHKWLTPEQYADRFGLSPTDMTKITSWLQAQGFVIVRTARARNFVVFSGTAAQVEKTLQVEIHSFEQDGKTFFANATAPTIPSALSGIVVGFHGLNNFRMTSQSVRAHPEYTYVNNAKDNYYLAPGDIAALYDINGLYNNGFNGANQSLAVIGQTGIFQSDLTNFRQNFKLSAINCTTQSDVITGCNTSNFKYILVNGSATNIYTDIAEADLDIEWSGATAPGAKVIFVTATDINGGGVWDSWYYAIDSDVAPVITMSYTDICEWNEAGPGTGEFTIAGDEQMLQQANMFGITFMNSAGDQGAASCDNPVNTGTNTAVGGYAVPYPASSQYVTGVGGTSIPAINPNEYTSAFWNSSNDSNGEGGSAKGYIQEQPWNDDQEFGYLCTPSSPCRFDVNGVTVTVTSWTTAQSNLGISAGGGGISNCAFVDSNDVCTGGFPQPSWQSGISMSTVSPNGYGITNNPARMVPDISLLASPNFPGYLVCTQNFNQQGNPTGSSCDSPTTGIADMLNACFAGTGSCTIFGGTSVSSPVFAGIVALLNQYAAANGIPTPVGNINPTLYTLAASNSTNHAFNPVTTGSTGAYSNGAYCEEGTPSSGIGGDPWPAALVCPSSGLTAGFLGFNAYNADSTTGYNLVTGLGSVDAGNLFAAWAGTALTPTTTTLQSSKNPSNFGDSVTFTATVTANGGTTTPTGTVTFYSGTTQLGPGTLGCVCDGVVNSATTSYTTSAAQLASGTDSITAVYGGDSNNASSTSSVLMQVVTAADFTVTNTGATSQTVLAGETTPFYSFTVAPAGGQSQFGATVNFSCSFSPADPTLTNTSCTFNPASIPAGTPGVFAVPVTLSVTTAGPNSTDMLRKQQRRRADNRLPWLPMSLPLAGIVMAGFSVRKRSKYALAGSLCLALVMAGFLVACGGGGSTPISVSVSGSSASIYPQNTGWTNSTATFTATVTNDSMNKGVTWSVSPTLAGQSITATDATHATYTPPTIVSGLPSSVSITATSVADTSKAGNGTMGLKPTTVPGSYTMTVTVTESTTSHTLTPALVIQ